MFFGLFGCASQPVATSQPTPEATHPPTASQNTWVASPSAKLPKGFPPPGPLGQVIVKEYPAYREAVVSAGDGGGKKQDANGMFFPLFNHIKRNNVPMSSPVEMRYPVPQAQTEGKLEPAAMAFVYPEPTTGKVGTDGTVAVIDVPAMTVVSVAVRGSYTSKHFLAGYKVVSAWLNDHADEYEVIGPPRYLAYHSPFVLPMFKLGEVQVPVRVKPK